MFIGAFLKQVRIKKNITLHTVSKELNIAIYNLEAIEEDKYSKTPGGVYTIGYIRAYSNYLNLDSNEIINEYKTQISLSEIPEPIELPKPVEASYSPIKIISFFAVVSISLVFYFLFINKFNLQPEYAITPDVPEGFESIIEEYEVEIALSKLNKSNKEEIIKQNNIISLELLKKSDAAFQNNKNVVIASKPTDSEKDELKNLISLKAIKPTWIQLRNINDEIIYSKLMNINDTYNYSLKNNFTITTGNAGNIVVSIGGNVMGKLGKQGEVLDSINISSEYFSN